MILLPSQFHKERTSAPVPGSCATGTRSWDEMKGPQHNVGFSAFQGSSKRDFCLPTVLFDPTVDRFEFSVLNKRVRSYDMI